MKKDYLLVIYIILCIIFMSFFLYYDYKNPVTLDDMSVEEKIHYEQMIFP